MKSRLVYILVSCFGSAPNILFAENASFNLKDTAQNVCCKVRSTLRVSVVLLLIFMGRGAYAQDSAVTQRSGMVIRKDTSSHKPIKNHTLAAAVYVNNASAASLYICPKCYYTCPNPVAPYQCPNDHCTLIGQGYYYCPKCYTTSNSPGTCPKCGNAFILMKGPATIPANNTQ